ncbi:DUF4388 domain-containing protein [Trichlorobacter lovleyi]|uniref:PatA-like N-terminal domain-containing protein n=1 Tax=Trichlorobacter lovleyi (strain ATCC BAA-1151 / DSM 17278 / SZ) TaxID=398767 RepID=B3E8J6_TRIL1|nr:DUF4388 domain-containing protein [Trichlorobacter lovleyi]ACD96672.1 hypothetical protein Glov_2965 [Trichlorobacter lovleyi SZ]
MAFSGDLEHLSIVDVIQLLHTTRKTGTLKVQGRKGEISVAFNDGYIVGASHYSKGALIGTILQEAGVITAETLQQALAIQERAGKDRKPLVATLLENGFADRDAAYHGLEALIELAIVEMLTWKKGSFALQVDEIQLCDEFRYFPDKLHQEITLPTEHVLMDALRIFDEKMRDGLLTMEDEPAEPPVSAAAEQPDSATVLSADDLGLGDLDTVKRKLPAFHEALKDQSSSSDLLQSKFNAVLKDTSASLQQVGSLPETARILLETVAALFPRALTLVAWDTELVAERGIGITTPRDAGPGPVMGFKIPLSSGALFSFILDKGHLFYGKSDDQALQEYLYPVIGAPADNTILLLPLKLGKRVVSLIYADFGTQQAAEVPTVQLEGCAEHAGMAIESALLRKQQTTKTT